VDSRLAQQSNRGPSRRPWATSLRRAVRTGVAVALGGFVLSQAPVAEASVVSSTPILVVHGFDVDFSSGINCKDPVMLAWVQGLRNRGFTNVRTVGWYRNDVNCDLYVPGRADNTVNTSLSQVGREFSNLVANSFGSTTVGISAHSMGGLVVRRALDGVHNHHSGFSANIRVSDVVTSGTPHGGTNSGYGCGFTQCVEVRPGSAFLSALEHNPQTVGSTDWTLIGSSCDPVVSGTSATAMNNGSASRPPVFKVLLCVSHDGLVTSSAGLNAINTGLRTSS
jgi:triacylglycerol esterase/lipase EstA (alpha/beta hydrolase family)